MCGPTSLTVTKISSAAVTAAADVKSEQPNLISRYACASIMIAIFGLWGKVAFFGHGKDESSAPGIGTEVHSWKVPLTLTTSYVLCLPLLRFISKRYISPRLDVKVLLKETMVVYNGGQVLLNGWMVYRFVDTLVNKGHPFIGDLYTVNSGATFAVWIHYMDKYLEFFDTIFMVLRGRMDQVRKFNCDDGYGPAVRMTGKRQRLRTPTFTTHSSPKDQSFALCLASIILL